jgi:hypothetical protein
MPAPLQHALPFARVHDNERFDLGAIGMAISGNISGERNVHHGVRSSRRGVAVLRALGIGLICLVLICLVLPAHAQQGSSPIAAAREQAQAFLDRMVQIVARPSPNLPPVAGFGFIVGERRTAKGEPGFLIVTADHLVRGPATPEAATGIVGVRFYSDLTRTGVGQLLPPHLSPDQGDLAVLVVPRPPLPQFKRSAAGSQALAAGMAAWQLGSPIGWSSPAPNARFALRDPAGWLQFDGLDGSPGSAGGAVITELGLAGMLVGNGANRGGPPRVLPVELIASKLAEWGLEWDVAGGAKSPAATTATNQAPASPAPAAPTPPAAAGAGAQVAANQPAPSRLPPGLLAPSTILALLPSEAASRGSWFPDGARVSPWSGSGAPLLSSPTRGSVRVGALPAGNLLPPDLWARGAYEVQNRLDNGAWFLLASQGRLLGYVSGSDVVEVWPTEKPDAPADGTVVRELDTPSGKAVLRDVKTHYTLTIPLNCPFAYCDSILVFTPVPPSPGSITPTFQVPQITGRWHENDSIVIKIPLPRALVETKGTQLVTCVGLQQSCRQQLIAVGG